LHGVVCSWVETKCRHRQATVCYRIPDSSGRNTNRARIVQWPAHSFRSRPEASWPRPDAPTTELWRFLRDALHANARDARGREPHVHKMGTGVGESDARCRGLARRRARCRRARTSHRSCCPSALPCPESQLVVLSAPESLCAARRRHMTPHRVLVVQSRRPLRMAMGHTSGALRSRNFASSARGLRPDGKSASMVV